MQAFVLLICIFIVKASGDCYCGDWSCRRRVGIPSTCHLELPEVPKSVTPLIAPIKETIKKTNAEPDESISSLQVTLMQIIIMGIAASVLGLYVINAILSLAFKLHSYRRRSYVLNDPNQDQV